MILCENNEGKAKLKVKGDISIVMIEFVTIGNALMRVLTEHDGKEVAREMMKELSEDMLLSKDELVRKIGSFYMEHPEFERGEE